MKYRYKKDDKIVFDKPDRERNWSKSYAKLVGEGKADIPDEVSIAIMCKEMKWDYWTYMNQPAWFIETLHMMKKVETEEERIKEKLNGQSN